MPTTSERGRAARTGGQKYIYELEPRDAASFGAGVPLKQDAVPGRVINGWLSRPDGHARYPVQRSAASIRLMAARIVIESPEQHAAWIAASRPALAANPVSQHAEGPTMAEHVSPHLPRA
jgi:hypothetical protein